MIVSGTVGVLHESLGDVEITRRLAQRGDDAGISSRREVDETAETLLWLIVDGQRSLVQVE